MSVAKLLIPLFVLALSGLYACSGDCDRASDCLANEVCVQGTCTITLSEQLTCDTAADCNKGGGDRYECRFSRCFLKDDGPGVVIPDSGLTDTGTTTGG